MLRLSESIDKDKKYDGFIPSIQASGISIVVPVKNNQLGIDRFLRCFCETHESLFFPNEIIIVDNNSIRPIVISHEFINCGVNIKLFTCKKKGPAAARNLGARNSSGQWVLFCDSDCIPTNSLISGYINTLAKAIAFTGNVKAQNDSWLDGFYGREDVLLPRRKLNKNSELVPLYLVTANALVWKKAFFDSGFFNEYFDDAGGEDVELSTRLWQLGNIAFVPESLVLHDFGKGFSDFRKRFTRYGRGNRQLETVQKICMKPVFQKPKQVTLLDYFVKFMQHLFISIGYYKEKIFNY